MVIRSLPFTPAPGATDTVRTRGNAVAGSVNRARNEKSLAVSSSGTANPATSMTTPEMLRGTTLRNDPVCPGSSACLSGTIPRDTGYRPTTCAGANSPATTAGENSDVEVPPVTLSVEVRTVPTSTMGIVTTAMAGCASTVTSASPTNVAPSPKPLGSAVALAKNSTRKVPAKSTSRRSVTTVAGAVVGDAGRTA